MYTSEITALTTVILSVLASASAGMAIAKRFGRSPVLGVVLGGLLPIVGVGILLLLGHKIRRTGAVSR
jgi:ABC-type glycerol-3-phosphate transport system permease component